MIDKKYIDITELRSWFQTYAEDDFNSKLITKSVMTFGMADGFTKKASIEPLFAVVSQVQYFCKKNGVTVVSWWFLQHIIISYIRQVLIQGRTVDSSNYASFVAPIMATRTDQGDAAFKEVYVLQTLQTLYKYRHDEIISKVYNFSVTPQNNGGSQSDVTPEIVVPSDSIINNNSNNNNAVVPSNQINPPVINPDYINQETSGTNPLYIGGAVLVIIYMLTKKNKRK